MHHPSYLFCQHFGFPAGKNLPYPVLLDNTAHFRQVGYQHRDLCLDVVEQLVGQGIIIIQPGVLFKGYSERSPPGMLPENAKGYPSHEFHPSAHIQTVAQPDQFGKDRTVAENPETKSFQVLHCPYHKIQAPACIQRPLVNDDMTAVREVPGPGLLLPGRRKIPDDLHGHPVFPVIGICNGAADCIAVFNGRQQASFYPPPDAPNESPARQLRDLGEIFMTVIYQADTLEPGDKITGRKGIQIIGNKHADFPEHQEPGQPEIEAGIEHETFTEHQAETFHIIGTGIHFPASGKQPANKHGSGPGLGQGHCRPVNALVDHKVRADGQIYFPSSHCGEHMPSQFKKNSLTLKGMTPAMPEILQHHSLRHLNTFQLDVTADRYCECRTVRDIRSVIREPDFRKGRNLIIGEGSNILFSGDFSGLVVRPAILGREIIREDRESVLVRAGAGENWDEFVGWATGWGFGGIENLSLIPGSVGSSPIQNIGAYGMEVCRSIHEVLATDALTGQKLVFGNEACKFAYRDSIFKHGWKDKCIITSVVFRLSKQPRLNLGYPRVAEIMSKKNRQDVETVREAVIEIRRSKLPDPAELGNAGSFFKNPVVPSGEYEALRRQYPGLPCYPGPPGSKKIPAAWLIEKTGWKGKRKGDAGTWEKQALVLVNHGNASGRDILELAGSITDDVEKMFGIRLEKEVNVI